eukprot:CAMPEP_0116911346 /NCGR_PEP_ID=MMETSP0467-20121206/15430_1 /TAXON_ID=283647 /ORGANISM="Mesodinium pulex, Strain SPMC105" /LENGTH=76 /DNA_ID=CAMNT_0004587105 /DNA_START=175 /DNA_END=405 /DNA_ORIENTATION=-
MGEHEHQDWEDDSEDGTGMGDSTSPADIKSKVAARRLRKKVKDQELQVLKVKRSAQAKIKKWNKLSQKRNKGVKMK